MNIIKNTNFTPGRNCGTRSEKVQYIVIHYTGSEGTAANNVSYFNGGNRGASAHYFVDRSGEIREYCDPAKYYAWHCGGSLESSHHPYYQKCTNRNSIGIEICTHNNGSNWEFTTAAVSAAVELTKYLMAQFSVPAANVIRHWDVTGKSCPRVPGWGAVGGSGEWDKFKARLGGAAVPGTTEARSLSKGDEGEDVKKMQQLLIACGYDCGSWGADGDFGSATESALERMQTEHGLSVDGVYGPKSKAALEALYKQKEEKKKREEQEKAAQTVTTNGKEIKIYYPGYTRTDSPDDRQGAGCVWHDQDGHCIVIDAYEKNSAAAKRLVQYLVDNKLYTIDFVGTHAHPDHLGGGFRILEDGRFKIENVYVYDPNSLKLAGDGTRNGRSAAEDKAYLQKFISAAKNKGAQVHYVETGDTIKCGEIAFDVYRNQPTHWAEDEINAWAYINDGSITLYSKQSYYITTGDADGSQFVEKYDLTVKGCEVGHHGNNGNRTSARIYVAHGCIFAIQCNNEAGQPGSCEFTRYGSGRMREAGVPVWQLTGDIYGVIKAGKITWTQGDNTVSWAVPFGAQLYRVRTAWSNSASQKGAYNVLANAKAEADKWGGVYAVYDWDGKEVYRPGKKTEDKTEPAEQTPQEAFVAKVGPMARADMQKNGICAAVTLAQAILESGWGKSELAMNANNLFGMKKNLSGNTWPGSVWDGKSVYSKQTKEVYASGPATVQADFRAYPDWQASVNDHSAYLAGARNGSALRYKGLVGETDYRKAATIIKAGGYATAPDYVDKICRIVEQYDLTKWDTAYNKKEEAPKTDTKPAEPKPAGDGLFRVRKSWDDVSSQKGAFRIFENARLKADECGLTVYDGSGKAVYTGKQAEPVVPFLIKVKTGMNIRKGPGTNYPAYRDCPVGVYTIVETSGDWGKLKAGGWIYIAQPRWVERI